MNIVTKEFGIINGEKIYSFTLENNNGMQLTCINLGCIVTEIKTPDSNGNLENVVLGYKTVEEYLENKTFFGAIVGRVAGRIANAQFEIDNNQYFLPKNEGNNHLHGGISGFNEKIWHAKPIEADHAVGIEFSYSSIDGEEGYPGTVKLSVTYLLTNDNEWVQTIKGTTDKKTLLNVTNHSFFNLSGNAKADILSHELTVKSDQFLELNDQLLPTGKMLSVEGTAFDFRNGRKLNDGRLSEHPQNRLAGNGYDHPFLLAENEQQEIILLDETSGRTLTVETNQPCVVIYTSNQMSDEFTTSEGVQTKKYLAVCLETQGLPDAIHHANFPSVMLEPTSEYKSVTKYTFGVR
ncbi:galactose mutarotase [Caldibacillus lycopersici]|uniref:Aldose 1-epimerase n=1 Tax=Perspicuibacillus lycopersici TaxID=1325689 RepID=A0AAE3IVT6_9BACI|nr:aldose epimerase family protein [Perspicuibacillus lycopersici]MCU9615137.1 galactose mutarotase [Perspicuibacillus lycopersici]